MIKRLQWQGRRTDRKEWFGASVPGNIQRDYADFCGWEDLNRGKNCEQYTEIEDCTWEYRATFENPIRSGERCVFVTGGIDYASVILLNGKVLREHEGMFSSFEIDLSEHLMAGENDLTVRILPHPKREDAPISRDQADRSCKYPASYGWDWHPRILPSGIWNDAYLELRSEGHIRDCEVRYTLSEALDRADVCFFVDCDAPVTFELLDDEQKTVYCGEDPSFTLCNPRLWWCNGQGEATLYTWRVRSATDEMQGKIGFRRVELRMNAGAWAEPAGFPKTRSVPPITLTLNGRRIFAKGSNFVSPDVFLGTLDKSRYEELVRLAKDANMNILRCWGGSGVSKEDFFGLCDEMGVMIWQEFPLACNLYIDDEHYMKVLEQEGVAIVRRLRRHPSVVLWCGGNELFNRWSGMTDQSMPLRLLNKICFEEDPKTPFIATSPLMGMAHGGYVFYDADSGKEVYEMFGESHCTAYTEFGVPSVASPAYLKSFLPEDELYPPRAGTSWETHHAFGAWHGDTWLCESIMERYFGKSTSLEEIFERSNWLQCEGYKAIFEEARRQKPYCSMAINWCYNEPWKTAANNSLLCYPALPQPAYHAVRNSLSGVVASARLKKFSYTNGELFSAELWLLNDSPMAVKDRVRVTVTVGESTQELLVWNTPESGVGENVQGHTVHYVLPRVEGIDRFTLTLESEKHGSNSYTLHYRVKEEKKPSKKLLNL